MAIVLSPPFPSSTRSLFLHVAKKKGKSSRARKEQQILSFLDRLLDDLHNFWERLQRIRAYVRWPRLEQFVSVAYRRGGGARLLQLQWAMGDGSKVVEDKEGGKENKKKKKKMKEISGGNATTEENCRFISTPTVRGGGGGDGVEEAPTGQLGTISNNPRLRAKFFFSSCNSFWLLYV